MQGATRERALRGAGQFPSSDPNPGLPGQPRGLEGHAGSGGRVRVSQCPVSGRSTPGVTVPGEWGTNSWEWGPGSWCHSARCVGDGSRCHSAR